MFNKNFFPTPPHVQDMMLMGEDVSNRIVLEPSAGKGDLVDRLKLEGAKEVLACEINDDLRKILAPKCNLIAKDFLTLTSDKVSHIDYIIMNPPFDADDKHILHAYDIAPPGCRIVALSNLNTVKNPYSKSRTRLVNIIEDFGRWEDIGQCFEQSERKTGVEVALIRLQKPGESTKEFEGFFMDDEPKEAGEIGIMPYNVVRDLVNRYVEAVKIYDEQLKAAVKLNGIIGEFFSDSIGFQCTKEKYQVDRNQFKKDLQKSGWEYIFEKMNMKKYATRGLKEDINKFVETQTNIPFTMKNIYKMLEIVIGTQGQRMDKAILEVFDKLTQHYHENRFNVEGWKTNSHYLMGEKFIIPNMCYQDQRWYKGQSKIQTNFGSYFDLIEDMMKAMCYITGDNYDDFISLSDYIRYEFKLKEGDKIIDCENQHYHAEEKRKGYKSKGRNVEIKAFYPIYGEWFDWGYFEVKAFKKGTMHFKFKSQDLWAKFNQRIAKLKGYPLYESVKNKK